jgi:UDP-N-acetylglucosamine 4,6-dehydratase (inverting)
MSNFNNKTILVTGGTGSFGKSFVREVLDSYPAVRKIIIFSRDELKQYEMAQEFSADERKKLRFFLGDVRDKDRLNRATESVNIIVHAAALKQVPAAEYNPLEFIKTNILGAENIIDAAFNNGVENVVALSTDKAAAPVNLYGATKLCSDKLFLAANNIKGTRAIKFSVVRYGNVMGSRGSVIPFFLKIAKKATKIPITSPEMTRFNISLKEGVDMVLFAINNQWGGELYVPKIPSYKILDVAQAIAPSLPTEIVGIRPGEKIHEEMITEADSYSTFDMEKYFAILPQIPVFDLESFKSHFNAKPVSQGFKYNSGTNSDWLNVEDIRSLIKLHVDKNFEPI